MADDPHDFQYSHVVYTRTGTGANGVTEIVTICRHCGASRKGIPDQAPTVDQLAAVYAKGLADALKEIEVRMAAAYRVRLDAPLLVPATEIDRSDPRTAAFIDRCNAFDEGRRFAIADMAVNPKFRDVVSAAVSRHVHMDEFTHANIVGSLIASIARYGPFQEASVAEGGAT